MLVLATSSALAESSSAEPELGLEIEDYFRLQRVKELALSGDGQWLAYVVNRGSTWEVRLHRIAPEETAIVPQVLQDARALAWIPGTHELAFLSTRAGSPQVFSYDTQTRATRQRTHATDPVESFKFNSDGKYLAYTTRQVAASGVSLHHKLFNGERGVLVDTDQLSIYDFVNPQEEQRVRPNPPVLWIRAEDRRPERVPVPGRVSSGDGAFFWSVDSSLLSVRYVADSVAPSAFDSDLTSVGVYDRSSDIFRSLARASVRPGAQFGVRYRGGEWIPGMQKMLLRRASDSDPWLGIFQQWAIVDLADATLPPEEAWRPIEANDAVFTPVSANRILVEDADHGVRTLFKLTSEGVQLSDRLVGADDSSSLVRFSADFSTIAFVNESLTRPQEIHVRRGAEPIKQVSNLNSEIARRVRYTARELSWVSRDGVRVHGRLLEPPSAKRERQPAPLVTYVQGGPGVPHMNTFASHFEAWPYPFELLAERGIAVFLPDYRGTHTYGRRIAAPERLDGEPVADIISGIESLIAGGVADPTRLGIAGHSHGAWLAPLVMARHRLFVAGSFAEGSQNKVLTYSMMPGVLNRTVHDAKSGGGVSLYDNWRPYVESSADLRFQSLRTATLWEGGAQSVAVLMMGSPKATRHAGAPTEFVVYPRTGHSPHLSSIQRESAERNLEWFVFWLQGEELQSAEKADQYVRWRALKAASFSK